MIVEHEHAGTLACPLARTFGNHNGGGCRGSACAVWRWEPISTSHPAWAPAVRAEAEKIGEKAPFPKASRIVADNLEQFGMTLTRGWCGLGGRPE